MEDLTAALEAFQLQEPAQIAPQVIAANADTLVAEELEDCGICLEVATVFIDLSCKHRFCESCIDRWEDVSVKGGKSTCPMCRAEYCSGCRGSHD